MATTKITDPFHVTAVIVSHDGAIWLPEVVAALSSQTRKLDQIVAVEASRSYSTFHLLNKDAITISKSLAWAEGNLQPLGFFRVHRSWLVNQSHITDFIKQNGYSLKMTTGLLIGITHKARSRVFEWIKSFTISD